MGIEACEVGNMGTEMGRRRSLLLAKGPQKCLSNELEGI